LPNTWVDITAHLKTKLRALACYESRLRPMPDARSLAAIRKLGVWRGPQQSFAAAEAFVCARRDNGSRLSREAHARLCERPTGKFSRPTHPRVRAWELAPSPSP